MTEKYNYDLLSSKKYSNFAPRNEPFSNLCVCISEKQMKMITFWRPYKSISDEELMRLVQCREEKAFDELWQRYMPAMQNFFFRRTGGNAYMTEDLTQDLFMQLWNASTQYQTTQKFRPWLFTIAFNLLRNTYRDIDYQALYAEDVIATTEEAQEDDTALQIDNERLFEALTKELNHFSAPEQLLFDLRFTDELSIKEIAAIFSIPDGTVKSRLHTLTLKLRKKLEDYA